MDQLDPKAMTPLYYQIMQAIIEEYKNKPLGTPIPSETELQKQFNVSRGTVQRAITELSRQGFVRRIQGKGTFVSKPRISREGTALVSFTEEIQSHGYKTSAKILRFEVVVPDSHVRHALELKKGETIYVVERIRFIENDPMAVVTSHIPTKLVPNLTREAVEYSVYNALRAAGCEPVKARDTFRTRVCDERMASLLQCEENLAVFISQRIAYTRDDVPVEYAEGIIKGQDYALTIEPRSKHGATAYFHPDQALERRHKIGR